MLIIYQHVHEYVVQIYIKLLQEVCTIHTPNQELHMRPHLPRLCHN